MTSITDLKLRVGPDKKYDAIEMIPKGGKVHCYGYYTKEPDGNIWLYVVYNGQIGFVARQDLI